MLKSHSISMMLLVFFFLFVSQKAGNSKVQFSLSLYVCAFQILTFHRLSGSSLNLTDDIRVEQFSIVYFVCHVYARSKSIIWFNGYWNDLNLMSCFVKAIFTFHLSCQFINCLIIREIDKWRFWIKCKLLDRHL